jgi:DNA primase
MITGERKTKISIEAILSRISEYDIFRYYMPHKDWKINRVTYSPFRHENNPSFMIGNKLGYLMFIDYSDTSKRGDCFNFVQMLHNISISDTLKMIDKDFGLGFSTGVITGEYKKIISEYKQPEIEKRNSLIQVKVRKFTQNELDYWAQYHQDIQDLRDNNIYSIKELYLNKQRFPLEENELRFGYLYEGQYWKIYRPFADKKKKWMPNNVPITAMDGKENIKNCEIAFINKSKKDYMVMKKLFPCSCAVQNEGLGCFSHENVEYLKANSDRQILSFDADAVGVQNSKQITEMFDFDYTNVPRQYLTEGIKDWADLSRKYGLKAIEECLKQKGLL